MNEEVTIVLVEDDEGHAGLVRRNLRRAGVDNKVLHFAGGQLVLDFLFMEGEGPHRETASHYVMLLDIRMPGIDGVEVLRRVKAHDELRKLPVIMLTTADDPREIERCHELGCSVYVTKPVDYEQFSIVIRRLALLLMVGQFPMIDGVA